MSSDDLVSQLNKLSGLGNADDEEISVKLTALLIGSLHSENGNKYTLSEISRSIAGAGLSAKLDPLQVIILLVKRKEDGVSEIFSLIGECGNSKEALIAVEEALQDLRRSVENDAVNEEDASFYTQLIRLVELLTPTIPRLRLRKRSAAETIKPLFTDLKQVIDEISEQLEKEQSLVLAQAVVELVKATNQWISTQSEVTATEAPGGGKAIAKDLFLSTFSSLSADIPTTLAQIQFEEMFPRFVREKTSRPASESALLDSCTELLQSLCPLEELYKTKTTGSLVLIALQLSLYQIKVSPNDLLSATYPALLASLQAAIALDSALFILLYSLSPSSSRGSDDIDPTIISSITYALVPVSSNHPDPKIRHITFRILGLLAKKIEPIERISFLKELVADCPYPQMRVAAVGLLKESVLEALSSSRPSPFASPLLLQNFGRTILRPAPPDLLTEKLNLEDFLEGSEPNRLTECLALYYVLLIRDQKNMTGVRDASHIVTVQKELLQPLKSVLDRWLSGEILMESAMSLAALDMSLERIGEAKRTLNII